MSSFLRTEAFEIRIDNFNDDFLLLQAERGNIQQIGKAIFEAKFAFIDEVIVSEIEICLQLNKAYKPYLLSQLADVELDTSSKAKTFQLPVFFDQHPDMEAVEKYSRISRNEIKKTICQSEFELSMFGFLPGFLYLEGLPKSLQIPRKSIPSKYVEAGSLAIGGKYLGLYAIDSPGGWFVIGRTPITHFTLERLPPISMNLGDKLSLKAISKKEYDAIRKSKLTLVRYNEQL